MVQEHVETKTRLLASLLRATLFWNLSGSIGPIVLEHGLYYHHYHMSAAEDVFSFMQEIGVLLPSAHSHKLAIRENAIDEYSAYIVHRGIDFDRVIDTFVMLLVDGGVSHLLPHHRSPFEAKFYDNPDGTADFDTRPMLADLLTLGFIERIGGLYQWTDKIRPAMRRLHLPEWK